MALLRPAAAGGTVKIIGAVALTGGAAAGKTAFSISGTTTFGNYTLGGSAVLENAGTLTARSSWATTPAATQRSITKKRLIRHLRRQRRRNRSGQRHRAFC
jgi:hypothetical protein